MPGGTPALNQPILIPFNMAGQLGGQQGLVLTLPTANLTNIQGLVAAAAAGGIMTLPLQNLQGKAHQKFILCTYHLICLFLLTSLYSKVIGCQLVTWRALFLSISSSYASPLSSQNVPPGGQGESSGRSGICLPLSPANRDIFKCGGKI